MPSQDADHGVLFFKEGVADLWEVGMDAQDDAFPLSIKASADLRFFAAPERRRLSAEQVVDSLFTASRQPIDVEEITLDADARRPADSFVSLGVPRRAWMLGPAGAASRCSCPSPMP